MFEDYEYLENLSEGSVFVNQHTGEVIPPTLVPSGSIVYTPEDQQRYQKQKNAEAKKKLHRRENGELGHFYFAHEDCTQGIKPQTLARIMFLATYIGYGNNILYLTQQRLLRKSDLPELMGLKSKTFYSFWAEVTGVYILEQPDGSLKMPSLFRRGALKKSKKDAESLRYQKIYIEAMRQLYKQTPAAKHCHLGYVFQMLPFLNWEYNVMCWNPYETELEKIQPMSLNELCTVIGYSTSQRARLLEALKKLIYRDGDKRRYLFSYVIPGGCNLGEAKMYVNPRVIYRGNNWHRVEILGTF